MNEHPAPVWPLMATLRELSFARSLDRVGVILRTTVRELTGADGATFVLKEDDCCVYMDEDAIAPLWKGRRFPLHACISGWAMLNRQIAAIPDIYVDTRIPHDIYRSTFVRSLVMVPIRRDDPIGAMGAYWASPHTPSTREIAALDALADAAALAIANARLYSDLESAAAREREARQQAEAANHTKDDFIAVLSHELRSPLQAALGWVTMLRRGQLNDTMRQRALDVIANSIEQQRQLVDDMLDLSRILAGRVPLERTVVDFSRVVRGTIDRLLPSARANDIVLEQDIQSEGVHVDGDAARLDQIVTNLIGNAVKFSDRGGRVRVSCRTVDGFSEVQVRDWGLGMSADALEHVFERYWQAEGGSTRRQGGLGVGLAITEYLVEAHGGTIVAESDGAGQGSTFTVRLPLALTAAVTVQETPVPRLRGTRVLVVDDNRDTIELLHHVLDTAGADVRVAGSVAEGLAAAAADRPDVVISDLHMPGADGYDLLAGLRAGGITAPALALTGIVDQAERQRALAHGFVRHLTKPLDPATLVREVAAIAHATHW